MLLLSGRAVKPGHPEPPRGSVPGESRFMVTPWRVLILFQRTKSQPCPGCPGWCIRRYQSRCKGALPSLGIGRNLYGCAGSRLGRLCGLRPHEGGAEPPCLEVVVQGPISPPLFGCRCLRLWLTCFNRWWRGKAEGLWRYRRLVAHELILSGQLRRCPLCQGDVWGKGERDLLKQIKDVEQSLPFPLLRFECNNGSDFLIIRCRYGDLFGKIEL